MEALSNIVTMGSKLITNENTTTTGPEDEGEEKEEEIEKTKWVYK